MAMFTNQKKDLIKRTKANLDFIDQEKKAGNKGVYETTQLFNSLLGIIVNIKEEEIDFVNFKKIILTDVVKKEWSIPKEINADNLGDFINNLRNSIAHIDITFTPDNTGEIASLTFKDSIKGKWEYIITIGEMHNFLNKLCEYIEKYFASVQ